MHSVSNGSRLRTVRVHERRLPRRLHHECAMCQRVRVFDGSMRDAHIERRNVHDGHAMRVGQLRRWSLLQYGVRGPVPSMHRREKRQWHRWYMRANHAGQRPRKRMHAASFRKLRTNGYLRRRGRLSALYTRHVVRHEHLSRHRRHGPNLQWHGTMRDRLDGTKLLAVRVFGRNVQKSVRQFK